MAREMAWNLLMNSGIQIHKPKDNFMLSKSTHQSKRFVLGTACIFYLGFVSGCTHGEHPRNRFSLPDGDIARGQATFEKLKCTDCHTIPRIKFESSVNPKEPTIALGGLKSKPTYYIDLVTSIINPSHRLPHGYRDDDITSNGISNMKNYNDEMTVTQLVDLVTFLETHYEVRSYQPYHYHPYY